MDFVTLKEFQAEPEKVWRKLTKSREIVVTRNGKPFALLTETSPAKLEDELRALRRARAEVGVASMRTRAAARGLNKMTTKEIDAKIRAARRTLKTKHAAGA
jgi:hypothetical protein